MVCPQRSTSAFGVNHRRLAFLLSGLGAAYAGVAGCFVALVYTLAPGQMYAWIGVVFAVVIIGGLGNPLGPLVAGIVIGVSESGVASVCTPATVPSAAMKIMSSGIGVFFIQKEWSRSSGKRKSMPRPSASAVRYMSPLSSSTGVRASSSTTSTGPRAVWMTATGSARAQAAASTASTSAAVRHAVMGEEAVEREATDDEIARMRALVAESLEGGALGISTNRNERHFREDGKPVSSRLATQAEFDALCDVLGDYNAGVIETILGLHTIEHVDWYDALARRTARPVIWQSVLHRWAQPDLWCQQLDRVSRTFADGYRVVLQNAPWP